MNMQDYEDRSFGDLIREIEQLKRDRNGTLRTLSLYRKGYRDDARRLARIREQLERVDELTPAQFAKNIEDILDS